MDALYRATALPRLPLESFLYSNVSLREVGIELLFVPIVRLAAVSSCDKFVHVPFEKGHKSGVLIIGLVLKILRGHALLPGHTILIRKVNGEGKDGWVLSFRMEST